MFDLADRYWGWRAVQVEKQRLKQEERDRLKEARKKYGVYMDRAKNQSANYSANIRIDRYFEECIESGVENVKLTEHYCHAEFNNGWKVKFWIANKMYGYCSNNTEFTFADGKKETFSSHAMPSMYMCFYIQDKVENFTK